LKLLYGGKVFIPQKKAVSCTARLKQIVTCCEHFMSLKVLVLYSLHIKETILYVKQKDRCITNDQIHTSDTGTCSHYHQHVCKLELNKSNPTAGGCNMYKK
jgi:hypothetical protein